MFFKSVVDLIHEEITKYLHPGEIAVDCTAGNGNDTLFMRKIVGEKGKVYAFDIQYNALRQTEKLLAENGFDSSVELIFDSHSNMGKYITEAPAIIVFNLGYLPGGDKNITTREASTLEALKISCKILKPGGVILLGIYWGHAAGEEEKRAVEVFLQSLPTKEYRVAEVIFPNRNKAPVFVIIEKRNKGK